MKKDIQPDRNDIIQWDTKFWCFRSELELQAARGNAYRVITAFSEEWLRLMGAPHFPKEL